MLLFANIIELKAQSGQKWSVNGNSTNNGDFIGTTNNQPLIFKTNNQAVIRLKPNGDIIFKPFDNIGTGLVGFNNDGKLLPYTFNGNANTFLNGAGQFVPINIANAWITDPANNNIIQNTNGYVGIGTNNPQLKLHVAGDAYVEGYVFTQGISIIGRAWGQKLYSDTIDVKLIEMDSLKRIEGETRILGKASVSDKLGVGTKYPEAELDVRGNMALSGEAKVNSIRIPALANAEQEILIADEIGKINKISFESLQQRMYFDSNIPYQNDPCSLGSYNQSLAQPLQTNSVSTLISPTWKNGPGKMYLFPSDCQNLKLGIGTSNPQAMLHLKQNAIIEGTLSLGTATLQNTTLLSVNGNANINGKLKVGLNSVIIESLNNFGDIINNIYADSDQDLHLQPINKTIGNVAVGLNSGTDYPEGKLTVQSDNTLSAIQLKLQTAAGANIKFSAYNVASGYNWKTQSGDAGIFWSDNSNNNNNAGFVIAPHKGALSGIRIDKNGVIDATGFRVNGVLIAGGSTSSNLWLPNGTNLYYNTGNVAIGDTHVPSGYKLAVNGKIITEEVNVKLRGNWPDFVFEKNYDLMPLNELEEFVITNKHLPNIKTETEICNDGIGLGEMQALQMQKIEEITLYLIELKKENNTLKRDIELLKTNK